MRILVLGGSGQIGWELQRLLPPLGEVLAPTRAELDLLDLRAAREAVGRIGPGVIVNSAAYTDVDRAESEPELARRLNAELPAGLAEEARQAGALLIHYSSDYVFDGSKGRPYVEEDSPNPLSVYGATKLEGDEAITRRAGLYVILRTSWVYSLRRPCFVTRVLSLGRRHRRLTFATDQIGSPTWCRLVAQATAELLEKFAGGEFGQLREKAGLYHLACRGGIDRYTWACEILQLDPRRHEQVVQEIVRGASRDFPTPAKRPAFSALDSSRMARTFGIKLPDWREALQMAMPDASSSGSAAAAGV
jgi:dTDP-4-dehydrorhamnose reductase